MKEKGRDMDLMWIIYLADVFDSIKNTSSVGTFVVGLALLILFAFGPPWIRDFREKTIEESMRSLRRWLIGLSVLWVFILVFNIFIPTSKTLYLMVGAKVSEDIAKSPEAKEIGNKILKVINQKLDSAIKE